ncbi:hypothetical protein [Geodermatophilus sp. DSM 45219]|uniref:hypothetical protein n=1 Tax=Geodermatophilus sp. DSM 45219 TaxID=1881103 RepID=UPI00088B4E23|nr:hypothetical protein [Geodermatophilus sp. DSM 45219]SDN78603.1 NUMOD3 motif-containing protein [Geodermatophilus sp. DSM 45219]
MANTNTATAELRPYTVYVLYVDGISVPSYVGRTVMTVTKRLNAHRNEARKGSPYPVHEWMRRMKEAGKTVQALPVYTALSRTEADAVECFIIAEYRAMHVPIANVADGGSGTAGVIPSAESLKKRSEAQKGRKRPPRNAEWCARISASKLGTTHTEETRRLISERTKAGIAAARARKAAEAAGPDAEAA